MSAHWELRRRCGSLEGFSFIYKHRWHILSDAVASFVTKTPRLRPIWVFIFSLVASVTPDSTINFENEPQDLGHERWRVISCGALAAFLFCFVGTVIFTAACGTWSGKAVGIKYFSDDWVNIFDYIVVCPAYVGLASWMIYLALVKRVSLVSLHEVRLARGLSASEATVNHRRYNRSNKWIRSLPRFVPHIYWMLLCSILFTVGMTYTYIRDLLLKEANGLTYWFMQSNDNRHYLNEVGIYYTVLNFLLLYITVCSVLCFFSLFIDAVRIGGKIGTLNPDLAIGSEDIRSELAIAIEGFTVAKCLCMIYFINLITWQISPLGQTRDVNIYMANFVGLLMGLSIIAFPRYYIEVMWGKHLSKIRQSSYMQDVEEIFGKLDQPWIKWLNNIIVISYAYRLVKSTGLYGYYHAHVQHYVDALIRILSH